MEIHFKGIQIVLLFASALLFNSIGDPSTIIPESALVLCLIGATLIEHKEYNRKYHYIFYILY